MPPRPAWYPRLIGISAFLGFYPERLATQGDMCRLEFPSDSIPSISCLHAVEHVGLGRYGDPIDPEGCFTAMRELGRVVSPGG